jgi:hypothetical protein
VSNLINKHGIKALCDVVAGAVLPHPTQHCIMIERHKSQRNAFAFCVCMRINCLFGVSLQRDTKPFSSRFIFQPSSRLERFSLLRQSDIAPRAKRGCFLKSFVYATMVSTAKVNIAAGNTQYTGALLMHTAGSLFII